MTCTSQLKLYNASFHLLTSWLTYPCLSLLNRCFEGFSSFLCNLGYPCCLLFWMCALFNIVSDTHIGFAGTCMFVQQQFAPHLVLLSLLELRRIPPWLSWREPIGRHLQHIQPNLVGSPSNVSPSWTLEFLVADFGWRIPYDSFCANKFFNLHSWRELVASPASPAIHDHFCPWADIPWLMQNTVLIFSTVPTLYKGRLDSLLTWCLEATSNIRNNEITSKHQQLPWSFLWALWQLHSATCKGMTCLWF